MNKVSLKHFNTQRVAAFTLVVLCIAAIYMVAAERLAMLDATLNEVSMESSEVIKKDAEREMLANNIRLHAEQSEGKLALLFFVEKKESRIPVYGEMDKYNAALDQDIARITPLLTSPEEKKLLSRLLALRITFRDNMQETVDALELNDREKAETLLSTSTRDNLKEIRSLVEQLAIEQQNLIAAREKALFERKSKTNADLSRSRDIVIGLGLGATMVVLFLGLMLTRRKPSLQ